MSARPEAPPVFVPQGTPRRVSPGAGLGSLGCVGLALGSLFALIAGAIAGAFASETSAGSSRLAALVPGAVALGGLAVVVASVRGWMRRRRLYVWGAPALGRVLDVRESGVTVNNRRLLDIRYTFPGPAGPVEGTMRNDLAPPVGAEVTVLYDPDRPERNLLPVPGSFGDA